MNGAPLQELDGSAFRLLVEQSADIVATMDNQGRILFVNPAVRHMLGYEPEELLGASAFDIVHPEDVDELKSLYQNMVEKPGARVTTQYRMAAKSGEWRMIESRAVNFLDTPPVGAVICNSTDITPLALAVEEVRRSEERVRMMLQGFEDIIALYDLDGTCLFFTGADAYGVHTRDMIGKNVRDMFPGKQAERILDQHRRVLKTGKALTVENELTWNGRPLWLLLTTYPVTDSRGNLAAIGSIGRNITAQKEAEREKQALQEQLNHIQKLDSVGALAGGIAHEFNNMLAVIMGNASLLLETPEAAAAGREELEEIIKAGERARDLSMKLLTFARRDKLNVQNVRVADLISEFAAMLETVFPPNIHIRWSAPDDLRIIADMPQMRQALLNLCNNARDAMPRGGTLAIEAADIRISESEAEPLAGLPQGRYCLVTVRDTGAGIPEPIRNKIFDPFFTTKGVGRGVGLGLSVAHGIVRNHDGRLFVDERPGPGAAVAFCIPASDMLQNPPAADNTARNKHKTVLVVDDEPVLLKLAQRILERGGLHVISACSGEQAIDTFRHLHVSIDLVILDMLLPDMDGAEVYRAMMEIAPDARVLLCSGASQAQACRHLLDAGGPAGFIQKPFTMDSLTMAVQGALAQSPDAR